MNRLKYTIVTGFVAAMFVFAGIGALALAAQAQEGPTNTPAVQAQEQVEPNEDNEAGEAVELQGQATISQADAVAAALRANPDLTVIDVELDKESGILVYEVELSNGADVMVDAGNGAIVQSDQSADEDAYEANDADDIQDEQENDVEDDDDEDNVQDEYESQVDDANEAPHLEDASGL